MLRRPRQEDPSLWRTSLPSRSRTLLLRVALGFAASGVALGVAEGLLRVAYPTLPSLSALAERPELLQRFEVEAGQRFGDDRSCEATLKEARATDEDLFPAMGEGGAARTLWFAGDSVTAAMGVGRERGWPRLLAARVAETTGGAVSVRDLSLPGVGYCEVLRRVSSELAFGKPDVVVIGLFADDLEDRALLAHEGQLVGVPHTIEHPSVRYWARRSYVANLLWFSVSSRPAGAVRFIDGPGRVAFQRNLVRAVRGVEAAGAQALLVLLPPVGVERCAPEHAADPTHRCAWLAEDLDLMATLLDEVSLPFVDLRTVWADHPSEAIADERGQELEIHPDAAGHAVLAEAIFGSAEPLLTGGRGD